MTTNDPQGTSEPIVVRSGDGDDVRLGRIILHGTATGGRLSLIDMRARPGVVVPDHVHRDAEELFYMVEGELLVKVGERELIVGPGDLVLVPRGVVHAHSNRAELSTRWLTMFSPSGTEGYFAERAHLAASTPADVERDYAGLEPRVHDELRERFGIEVMD